MRSTTSTRSGDSPLKVSYKPGQRLLTAVGGRVLGSEAMLLALSAPTRANWRTYLPGAEDNLRLIGPLTPDALGREREIVQSLTLTALRALGVADARARGLLVQTAIPAATS
jgi:hypothetical protein